MRLKAYTILWDEKLGNVKLHQKIELKKMPRKGKDWIEKDAQKEKILKLKKISKLGKIVLIKMKNGLTIIYLPI